MERFLHILGNIRGGTRQGMMNRIKDLANLQFIFERKGSSDENPKSLDLFVRPYSIYEARKPHSYFKHFFPQHFNRVSIV